jgi:predicted nucleic acid-binding protein
MKRAFVDANVILRFLTKDPLSMAEVALKIFEEAKSGKVSLLIIPITVAEVVWVLESFYGYPKEKIAETMTQFLSCEGLDVESLDLLLEALNLYYGKNLDFADALLATTALRKKIPTIYSFDQHFDRINGIKRVEPPKVAHLKVF